MPAADNHAFERFNRAEIHAARDGNYPQPLTPRIFETVASGSSWAPQRRMVWYGGVMFRASETMRCRRQDS
jgi:hypothetical protein